MQKISFSKQLLGFCGDCKVSNETIIALCAVRFVLLLLVKQVYSLSFTISMTSLSWALENDPQCQPL